MKNKNIFMGIILLAFIILAVIVYSQLNNSYLISGRIYNDRVELNNLIKADYILVESGEDGSVYRAEFLDSNNNLLRTFRFGISEQADYETQELYKEFYFILNLPAETKKIIIKENSNVIHEFIITENSPIVNNIEINENELGSGKFEINWQASDVDGEALSYDLYYGENNVWNIINLEITETNYLLETNSIFFPGGNYKIRVVASDGFNTGEAVSQESFSVSEKGPDVSIININEGQVFFTNENIVLEGFAYDVEDGELNGLWKLDGSSIGGGNIVVLENLESGTHLIGLSASDSDGNVGSDAVEIVVKSNLSSNNSPILAPIGNQSVVVGYLIGFSVTASDEDNDTLTFTNPLASELPQGASFRTTLNEQGVIEGLFSWTPTYEQIADYQVNFVVSDGELSDSEIINIEVVAPFPYIQSLSPTKGQVGSYLWISGKDFGIKNQASRVEFSNSETGSFAQIYYWYDNYILVYVPELAPGIYKVTIINQGGRSNFLDFTIISPPSLTITSPQANNNVSNVGFNFTGTVKDDTGVVEVRVHVYDYGRRVYTVNNALANYNSNTNIWSFQVLSSHITTGNKAMLLVRAKDTEGNWNSWQNIVVNVVDIAPPFLTITYPQTNNIVSRAGFNFTGTANDISGIAEVRVYVYDYGRRTYTVSNSLANNYNSGTNTWSFQVLSSHITQGQRAILWARAKDKAGNWNYWQYVIVNIA